MLQEVLWNLNKRGALPHPEFVDGRADERRVPPAAAPHRQVCKFASQNPFRLFRSRCSILFGVFEVLISLHRESFTASLATTPSSKLAMPSLTQMAPSRGGLNRCEMWQGFAKRGLGVGALVC
jgi:hypothetical protein